MNESKTRSNLDIEQKIGKKLREIRIMRGLSQANLGQKLSEKISLQQVQKYEKGLNRISASRIYDLAKILDVSIYEFFDDSEGLPKTKLPRKTVISIIRSLEKMRDEEKSKFLALAKAIVAD